MSILLAASSGSQAPPGGIEGWLLHFHGPVAYALVGFLAFAEAGLMVGFFIPGETAVVIGGALAGLHRVNLGIMMIVVVVCAIAGDSSGFEVGRRSGPWLLERRPLRGSSAVRRTLEMLEHYGGPAVFLGRFVAFARAIIPGLAGMSGLRYRTFLLFNASGGLVWGVGYSLLGFVVGISFGKILSAVGLWSLAVIGGVVVVAIAVRIALKRRERRRLAGTFADLEAPLGKHPTSGGSGGGDPTSGVSGGGDPTAGRAGRDAGVSPSQDGSA